MNPKVPTLVEDTELSSGTRSCMAPKSTSVTCKPLGFLCSGRAHMQPSFRVPSLSTCCSRSSTSPAARDSTMGACFVGERAQWAARSAVDAVRPAAASDHVRPLRAPQYGACGAPTERTMRTSPFFVLLASACTRDPTCSRSAPRPKSAGTLGDAVFVTIFTGRIAPPRQRGQVGRAARHRSGCHPNTSSRIARLKGTTVG